MNTKIGWILAILVVVAGGVYAYTHYAKGPTAASVPQEQIAPSTLILQGAVTGVDADKLQITIATVASTSAQKIVTISPATKIEKIISQKDAKGVVEKQGIAEVNIIDVPKGSQVTVVYQSDTNNVLSGVSQITFVVEGNIDAYFKAQAESQTSYSKGQVVAVDIAGKSLSYKPFFFNTLATTTASVAIPDGIAVYRIDDPTRVAITYARTAATLADIQPGQTILIAADPAALKAGKMVPQAFIISAK